MSDIQHHEKENVIALFNYGGGLRGLIPAHIMTHIEKKTGHQMSEMVDVFCGPSTGSILNAALTIPHPDHTDRAKYYARHLVRFYEREALNIFPPDKLREMRGLIHDFNHRMIKFSHLEKIFKRGHYDPKNLGTALKALYGDHKLSDSRSSLIIPVYNIDRQPASVAHNFDPREQYKWGYTPTLNEGGHATWFKNVNFNPDDKETYNVTPDVSMYDLVMASCSAPTYFPCHSFTAEWPDERGTKAYAGIDGNIFDNPPVSYFGAIKKHLLPHQNLTMISLGTGYMNTSIPQEVWNRFGSLGVVDPVNDLPLINIFFHASESALMHGFLTETGQNLHIFNAPLDKFDSSDSMPSQDIDDGSPENLKRLKLFAEQIIEDNQKALDHVCEILVKNYEKKNKIAKEDNTGDWKKRFFTFMRSETT